MRILKGYITTLNPGEIFVFGSNESGKHNGGAALTAMKWGAIYGQPYGLQGSTFAIPTVNFSVTNKLPVEKIQSYVSKFIQFAKEHKEFKFLVTEIGCGIAGFTVQEIAPLFKDCIDIENIYLPERFVNLLI